MINLVCILEEPSAREMLKIIIPKIFPSISFQSIVFEGKQDLEKQLIRKLRYWEKPNSYFLIMRDQDSGDCKIIKNELIKKVQSTGKEDRTIVRIACHELESYYLGDLEAVEKALSINNLSNLQNKKKFRNPDKLSNASEELKKITKDKYKKIQGSRQIAECLKLDGSNSSNSFNALLDGLEKLIN